MKRKLQKEWLRSYLWSGPSLLLIALVVVFPILYTFYISLTNMNVYHWFDFTIIGLENYIRALFVFDSGFLSALLVTVLWTVVNMVLQLVIAFVLASLLNIQNLRFRKLYKTLLMFPWAMPGYVSILLWKTGMFNTQFGLLNQWMEKLGLETMRWLSSDVSAFICCTAVNLWLALPFMIMIMDGAMQSIDKSYFESALLDGAGWGAAHPLYYGSSHSSHHCAGCFYHHLHTLQAVRCDLSSDTAGWSQNRRTCAYYFDLCLRKCIHQQ